MRYFSKYIGQICAVFAGCFTANAQIPGGEPGATVETCTAQQHLAQIPPGWTALISPTIQHDWYKTTVLDETLTITPRNGPWKNIDEYACTYKPCNQIVPPAPSSLTADTEYRFCLTVGTSISTTAAAELKIKLLTALSINIQVTWNLEAAGCITKRESFTYSMPRFQCYPTKYRETWLEQDLQGKIEAASERRIWPVQYGDEWTLQYTYCGYEMTNGNISNSNSISIQQAPFDHVLIEQNDPWDGVRSSRCCTDPPSPADPCCGCWSQQ